MSYRDITVARTSEFTDGEMKQVSVEGKEILLARVNGNFYAVGATCTHYGAPLVDGVLNGERLVCPWHHACFNITNGDLREPPAFDALPRYDVHIENEQVVVRVPVNAADRRTPSMTRRDGKDERLFVIAGGGAAGYTAAQTLREDGFTGRIVLITREDHLPYDRPNLSKDYLQGNAEPSWLPLRSKDFFADHDIELIRGAEIKHIESAEKTVTMADGETLVCDALLVATGGQPRHLPFQSATQKNVFLLRSYADAGALIAAAETGKRVIVIGASFIGMETASSLRSRGCDVTVVAPDDMPFEKILGSEIGRLFQGLHEEHGVKFKLGSSVANFVGQEIVTHVVLENGEELATDLVVVGIGVRPATEFLDGVSLHRDGGVIVDECMRAAEDVYAAGDIAYFPDPRTGERQRIEHWRTAMQQARVAAHNMAGNAVVYDSVPFFWTRQFDVALLYVGHASSWSEIIFQGSVAARDFLAFYLKDDQVLAVAGMNRDREMAAIEELMREKQMPTSAQLRNTATDFLELLRAVGTKEVVMSDSNNTRLELVADTNQTRGPVKDKNSKLMMLVKVLAVVACLIVAGGYLSNRSRAQRSDDRTSGQHGKRYDQQISDNALRMMQEGKQIFRYDTFGSEDFWGGKLRLHESIAGAKLGGIGNGVSPKTALALGLKVDAEALPAELVAQIRAGRVDLDDPATTMALLKLKAVVGITGFFNEQGNLRSIGIQCALCHSNVDDSFAPGIGMRLDGWGNRDLNVGAIVATAPNLKPFSDLLGVNVETVKAVLNSWGPGRYDAELNMDGKARTPDGKVAATLMPSAFGLAGVNQHTWTGGWGTVTYWNAYVANTQMYGQGTFYDSRLENAQQYPVAAKAGWGHKRDAKDLITAKLPALHFYQLAMPVPKPPPGSYDAAAAQRGQALFNGKATCATCHVPPIFTEPGHNLHKAEEIGIDSFQANRGPERSYVTTPLRALFDTQKIHKGGFYHDGRFATLLDVVNHYNGFKKLNLTEQEKKDLVEYLKSL